MKRLLTAAVGTPLVVAGLFLLPPMIFFVLLSIVGIGCAVELSRLMQGQAPDGPLWLLPILIPVTSFGFYWVVTPSGGGDPLRLLLALSLFVTTGVSILVLASGVDLERAPVALGLLSFGVIYLSLPVAVISVLQEVDPWLVLLLLAIVWMGDAAAYYVGSAIGRRKLAPRISPNKSWEGAIASFGTALGATVAWCFLRLGTIDFVLVGIAALTAVAAQLGDLLESSFKRSVHIKDSGNLLPGHGGLLDRLDALLLSAPVFFVALWLLRWPGLGK